MARAARDGDDRVVGWITSGGYAHYSGALAGMGIHSHRARRPGPPDFEIEIIGKRRPARLQLEPILDPHGERMRA